MLLLLIPPHVDNLSTQVRYEERFVNVSSSTLFSSKSSEDFNKKTIEFMPFFREKLSSTQIYFNEYNNFNNSTWTESSDDNFDVISKLVYTKTFKVKSRIKTIIHHTPKIVIE